jgi:vesicle coat complex subunit
MNGTQLETCIGLILTIGRKEAIQKTIMAMTLGKDVSALFPDVLKNIATADLDQKKLVYLYLMSGSPAWPASG